ncbi:histidine kinase dimerization/phospho-acceptor domain-containing protein, partial [Geomonas sp.]|uniref:histidine kinase dimerization/phospho-acceptor domain-containing protein n=1 Tax=Geomonas sp. TaxID=2651584 RepID=UPI002B45A649
MRVTNPSTIRHQLAGLMLAAVLPVWLVSGWLVFHAYSAKRDQVSATMQESARSLAMVVDRDLASVQAALQALATSPAFLAGDFTAVHGQVMELLKSYPGADIIVADQSGQQLVNSARPLGTPLPRRNNPETVRRIFTEGKPVVSNLFFGALTKRPLISIDVPVAREGKVLYDLAMTFPSDRMGALLRQQRLSAGWYSVIVDGKTVVVARSRYPERFVGKQANPAHLKQAALAEGSAEYENVEGERVLVAFCRSSLSPWRAVVGVPKAVILSDIYLWTGWAIAAAGLISLFGIGLALSFARRIAGDIHSLAEPAAAIGRGEPVAPFGSFAVSEIGVVASALRQASDLIQVRERELERSLEILARESAERREANERLEATLADLKRSNEELEQFAYIASHDLQEPLRMIASYTQLLDQRYGDRLDDKAKKFIGYAVDGAVRMQRLINDLLEYSRVSRRGAALEPVEARVALADALGNLGALLQESQAVVLQGELPTVRADVTQLCQ